MEAGLVFKVHSLYTEALPTIPVSTRCSLTTIIGPPPWKQTTGVSVLVGKQTWIILNWLRGTCINPGVCDFVTLNIWMIFVLWRQWLENNAYASATQSEYTCHWLRERRELQTPGPQGLKSYCPHFPVLRGEDSPSQTWFFFVLLQRLFNPFTYIFSIIPMTILHLKHNYFSHFMNREKKTKVS